MDGEVIIQSGSLFVYALVMIFAALVFFDARRSDHSVAVRLVSQSLMAMTFAMAAVFSVMQGLYIAHRSWDGVPLAEVAGWIAYDWANGLTHLAFVLAARVLLQSDHVRPAAPPCHTGTCPGKITLKKTMDLDRELAEIQNTLKERSECL